MLLKFRTEIECFRTSLRFVRYIFCNQTVHRNLRFLDTVGWGVAPNQNYVQNQILVDLFQSLVQQLQNTHTQITVNSVVLCHFDILDIPVVSRCRYILVVISLSLLNAFYDGNYLKLKVDTIFVTELIDYISYPSQKVHATAFLIQCRRIHKIHELTIHFTCVDFCLIASLIVVKI